MKENKFRIWNGMEMVYEIVVGKFGVFYVNPGSKGDGLDENDSASLTRATTKYDKSTRVMRYTGIKDKNKKEIWEGDIVEVRIPEEYGGDLDEDGKEQYLCRQEVKASKESGGYYTIEDTGEYCPSLGSDEVNVEVLGNIYENPKLLK